MTIRIAFTALALAVFAERLWELRLSARRDPLLLAGGGRAHAVGPIGHAMRWLHASWVAAALFEVWWLRRLPTPVMAGAGATLLLTGMMLRALSMRALRDRWTVTIVTIPGMPVVRDGVYRVLRRPNYLAVLLEMPGLPLLGGAWITATIWGILNAAFLASKIAVEERALLADTDWGQAFAAVPRFIPRFTRRQPTNAVAPSRDRHTIS